jgi:hypothetical protein
LGPRRYEEKVSKGGNLVSHDVGVGLNDVDELPEQEKIRVSLLAQW